MEWERRKRARQKGKKENVGRRRRRGAGAGNPACDRIPFVAQHRRRRASNIVSNTPNKSTQHTSIVAILSRTQSPARDHPVDPQRSVIDTFRRWELCEP